MSRLGSSPHTRGAPPSTATLSNGRRIIPAYAGSTRSHDRYQPRQHGSSPHTRGALDEIIIDSNVIGIIPAYAGSTGGFYHAHIPDMDHPRIRGEHVSRCGFCVVPGGSSPHTRGARAGSSYTSPTQRIIPAYAGSTAKQALNTVYGKGSSPHTRGARLRVSRIGIDIVDHPRIRGEHLQDRPLQRRLPGSSPHTRGALALASHATSVSGIIPAYAGSTCVGPEGVGAPGDHPRIRGEHTCSSSPLLTPGGSSPHTRGARPGAGTLLLRGGIIPAYAGSTSSGGWRRAKIKDHPRIRGEHCQAILPVSSPARIIPAYAGSTSPPTDDRNLPKDHPRIRGEHVDPITIGIGQWGSSPHTRGAHRPRRRRHHQDRIIPAYAGSTRPSARGRRRRTDHPRIRGEHASVANRMSPVEGSSPHTRGARPLSANTG